eukprot:TRINITY_DN9406_c0_g1_i2.p1 TRINITY_DN9406_c0_g1~~TRINITY_DN9406_c0_g1_i2.p1  ORF type:complete len:523 (+),score=102.59 TRINITY_DN9406_c0_g1_i2:196-1764(+)
MVQNVLLLLLYVGNRWRRQHMPQFLRQDTIPKNILLIGSTGVGKTEVARRMATLLEAPFIKVEATKYTEVGYHGLDVDTIIKDLFTIGLNMVRKKESKKFEVRLSHHVDERLLDFIVKEEKSRRNNHTRNSIGGEGEAEGEGHGDGVGSRLVIKINPSDDNGSGMVVTRLEVKDNTTHRSGAIRVEDREGEGDEGVDMGAVELDMAGEVDVEEGVKKTSGKNFVLRKRMEMKLKNGELEDYVVHIIIPKAQPTTSTPQVGTTMIPPEITQGLSEEELLKFLWHMQKQIGPKQPITVRDLRKIIHDNLMKRFLDQDVPLFDKARRLTEDFGVVFIDEIDKLCSNRGWNSSEASGEGVQRDLLPIIEGTKVQTDNGEIDTSNILFMCAGAFSNSKPSDLLPELQGRLPIRVKLDSLTAHDLYRILNETESPLLYQNKLLLSTENIDLRFTDEAIMEIAITAEILNKQTENTGARKLHTIVEKVLGDISFNVHLYAGKTVVIDKEDVQQKVESLMKKRDRSLFIL